MRELIPTPQSRVHDLAAADLPEVPLLGVAHMTAAEAGLPPHTHPSRIEIHYLKMGEQTFRVGRRDYRLTSGDLFVTWPHERHGTGGRPHGRNVWCWTQIRLPRRPAPFLGLAAPTAWPIVRQLRSLPRRHFRGNAQVERLFYEAFELVGRSDLPAPRAALGCRLALWLLAVIDCATRGAAARLTPDIRQAVAQIESHVESNLALDELADAAHLSVSRFKAKFKEQTGLPPGEFAQRTKMRLAHRLLREGALSVTQIAYRLGFPSSQYFATRFKQFTHLRPSEVRPTRPAGGRKK